MIFLLNLGGRKINLGSEIDATSFSNSPPNQMSHCPQWGSDWKVREESATSLMKCTCCWIGDFVRFPSIPYSLHLGFK